MLDLSWIKEGMTVVVYNNHSPESYTVTVERFTPTQIVMRTARGNEIRFRRDNGKMVGDSYGGELRPTTDPDWLEQKREKSKRNAIAYVKGKADELRWDVRPDTREKLEIIQWAATQALRMFPEEGQ